MRGEPLLMAMLAGGGSGLLMGTIFVGLGALLLPRLHRQPPKILSPLFKGVSLTSVALPLTGILLLLWGLIGAVLGVLYLWFSLYFPGVGLGSPNWPFSALILALSIFFSLLVLLLSKRAVGEMIGMSLAFALIFGWLLPWLAS